MMLGDLGADVIKVERTGTGDETRSWGPPFDERGESAYFLSVNRNKRSLSVDMDRAADINLLLQLAQEADVVVENFLPGSLSRKGLDAASLLAQNDGLIWCTIGGYPAEPSRPGYDFAIQAESGWMSITGDPDGVPMKTGVAFVDVIAGKDAAIAILAALAGRARSRAVERHLRITLAGSATAALVNVAQNTLVSGVPPRRWGNAHANLVPYQLFETADRPIVVAVGNDTQWQALVRCLDSPELANAESLRTNPGRVTHRTLCISLVQAALLRATAAEWVDRLIAAGVPTGAVRDVMDVLASLDASPLTGLPSAVGGSVRRPPPGLGEHDREIRDGGWRSV